MQIKPDLAVRTPYSLPATPAGARETAGAPAPVDAALIAGAPIDAPATQSTGVARGIAIGLLVAAAIGGAMVSVAGSAHADPQPQTSISTTVPRVSSPNVAQRTADRAIDSLTYLNRVGARGHGGLYVTTLGIFQRQVTPEKAFYEMADGGTVEFVEQKGATPHDIRSFDDLETLRDQVQQQEIRNAVDRGVEEIKKDARSVGNVLRDIGDQIKRGIDKATDR